MFDVGGADEKLHFFAFLLFDRINMFDVGGTDEEEFADEHLRNSEGLKGTEKLFFVENFSIFFAFLLFDRINIFDVGGADEKLLFVEYVCISSF